MNKNEKIPINKKIVFVDGIILAPTRQNHERLCDTLWGDYPVVLIDRKPEGYSGDYILVVKFKGVYDTVALLIKKGHNRSKRV